MEIKTIPFYKLGINWNNIWRESGHYGFRPDKDIESIFISVQKEIENIATPMYGYKVLKNENSSDNKLRLGGIELNVGALISSYLNKAEEFIIFVATVGKEYEEYMKRLSDSNDIVKSFFADLIGSAIAEHIGSIIYEEVCEMQNQKGFTTSYSYSPGYCDWPLSDQAALFSLFPPNPCGITLTDSHLMLPIKSISGILGSGREVKKNPHNCAICNMKNCFRKKMLV